MGDSLYTSSTISAGTHVVTLLPRTAGLPINFGGSNPAPANFNIGSVTAGTLNIGDANSGSITMTGSINLQQPTNVSLTSGGSILIPANGYLSTEGGSLTLTSGSTGSVQPLGGGLEFYATPSNLAFGAGSNLAISINSLGQYGSLVVWGGINITGGEFGPHWQ